MEVITNFVEKRHMEGDLEALSARFYVFFVWQQIEKRTNK
jgi:hypothetical protein